MGLREASIRGFPMGKKLAYERYHWFHGQIKAGRYPNARRLGERFEISEKQAQREIEFMSGPGRESRPARPRVS